jgi:hypothetical protein
MGEHPRTRSGRGGLGGGRGRGTGPRRILTAGDPGGEGSHSQGGRGPGDRAEPPHHGGPPAPDLATELAVIRATPADRVRADIDHLGGDGPRCPALYADPETRLAELCQEIQGYWDIALAPYWAKIRALLDADVFYRAGRSPNTAPVTCSTSCTRA